jgi:hypothetical protein
MPRRSIQTELDTEAQAADRRRQPAALAEEARRAAADPADRAEVQAIMAELESIGPDWPE